MEESDNCHRQLGPWAVGPVENSVSPSGSGSVSEGGSLEGILLPTAQDGRMRWQRHDCPPAHLAARATRLRLGRPRAQSITAGERKGRAGT